ncbi:MAG: cytochrome-c oxidase, cbb3-type subunit I [Myxococcales bacterium]|nr:cytochrome-c oxidase, cbb3-type subunit I [Myxococcales bacterium]
MSAESAAYRDPTLPKERVVFNDWISRYFVWASLGWGLVGMLVGVIVALQMAFWQANLGPYLTFGRLRPLHTNAVIFAFVGNMIFAGIYYSTQRLLRARLASDLLAKVHFWGWQAIIVSAAITLPLGLTQGKEYAELEWPIDLAIAAVWVVFAINFFWTLARRNEKHLYVAIWFYIATIVTVAVLHIVNALSLPVSPFKSYSIYAGVQDALVQWWYGHNAVAFFLTTPVLGIMYYFVPKAAERPVYSYRLSIVHFWALVFMYIWAGPHHLLFTALPDWAQTLGMIFSVMLWAPSWGGMINGLLTLRGGWTKLRTDPVLKFFAAGITFYGMATFEGPLLSIKSVSGLAHYTDWIIGHVHSGALGWNGFMAAGMFYWMVPRFYGRKLHSTAAANLHFYLGTVGILLYVISMWVSGVTQGLMLRATTSDGALTYPSFVETLIAIRAMYWARAFGGTLYLVGMFVMAWNLVKTAAGATATDGEIEIVREAPKTDDVSWTEIVFAAPVWIVTLAMALFAAVAVVSESASVLTAVLAVGVGFGGSLALQLTRVEGRPTWHRLLEGRAVIFTVFTLIAVLVGGVAEIVPTIVLRPQDATAQGAAPYRPLELEGRDLYLREGCYTCHSQMIRPFRFESQRYGEVSTLGDSRYDHPFQWGSKRTGPDLAREGGRYPNLWHYRHLIDPRATSPGSNMPPYADMAASPLDLSRTRAKLEAMRTLGVPYTDAQIERAVTDAQAQAREIAADLASSGAQVAADREVIALIAYLQRLGRNPSAEAAPAAPAAPATPAH